MYIYYLSEYVTVIKCTPETKYGDMGFVLVRETTLVLCGHIVRH